MSYKNTIMAGETFKNLDHRKINVANFKLFGHFYLFSIVLVILILVIAGLGLHYVLRNLVIQAAEIDAIRVSTAVRDCEIRRYIGQHYDNNESFLTIPPAKLPEVDQHMRVFIAPFDIVKINIFNAEARVIYSTDSKAIGKLESNNSSLLIALAGTPNTRNKSREAIRNMEYIDDDSINIVDTYVPMYGTDGEIIGSFEVYKDIRRNLTLAGKIFTRSWSALAVIVLGVFAILMFVIRNAMQTIRTSTANLVTANQQLQQEVEDRRILEKEFLSIIERERQRIGQELHDSVGQQLTGIGFMIETLEEKLSGKFLAEEASYTERINTRINQATKQVRKLLQGLHPVDLDKNGLLPAIHELALNTEDIFNVSCTLKCTQHIPIKNASIAINLYRIVQEAITNAVKHGKAKNINIKLTSEDGYLTLMLENDGLDFPTGRTQNKGMGLKIMRYRAEIINGSLDICKGSTGGTIITCMLPKTEY